MNTFEKPLTPSEEQEYLKRYKNGDEEAGNVLILRNLRLVAHIVKHYNFDEKDIEEYLSIGTIGLIKAIKTFDCSKGNRIYQCIWCARAQPQEYRCRDSP